MGWLNTRAKTWDEIIKRAMYAYTHQNEFAYFYGAKGQILTDDVMNALIACEPNYFKKYSAAEIEEIKRNSRGKRGLDCSGFIGNYCLGVEGYSAFLISQTRNQTTDLYKDVAGSLLYTTRGGTSRHIGLDCGFGFCIDMATESTDAHVWRAEQYRVGRIPNAQGCAGVRFYKINEPENLTTPWELAGESIYISYDGADAR